KIKVNELATSAMNVSTEKINIDKVLEQQTVSFTTFDKDGNAIEHDIEVEDGQTIKDVLGKINSADNNVRAFYDQETGKVIMETTRTGSFNTSGEEIVYSHNSFFTNELRMVQENEVGGTDASFVYNDGLELTSKTNSYTLNNITFNFHGTTKGES